MVEQEKKAGKSVAENLVFFVLFAGLTWFIITRFANLNDLFHSLSKGLWQWALAAIVAHVLYFILNSALYQASFAAVGVENSPFELFPVLMASLAVNAVAPTGGAGGAAIFVNYNAKQGKSGARTATGVILTLVADLSTLAPFIIWSIVFLANQGQLKYYEILGFAVFLIFVLGMGGILVLADQKPEIIERLFQWFQKTVNRIAARIKRPRLISDDWARANGDQFVDGAQAIVRNPILFLIMLLRGIVMHIVNLIGLWFLFVAYQQPVSLGTLIAGLSLGIVFFVVTVVPQGIGAVEGIMTLVFISLGVPQLTAITITVAFRGLNFWLPLILGLIFLRKVT